MTLPSDTPNSEEARVLGLPRRLVAGPVTPSHAAVVAAVAVVVSAGWVVVYLAAGNTSHDLADSQRETRQ